MKKIVLILAACALLLGLGGCKFAHGFVRSDVVRALVELPGGESMSIDVEHWEFNENGFYKITAKDGRQYIVAFTRCVLIGESTGDAAE